VSVTLRGLAAPATRHPLLYGLTGEAPDAGIQAHQERWGVLRHGRAGLIDQLDASGLAGHGGACFPVATKWKAVAQASRRRPVVVANGAEGEPASKKDAFLLAHAPHLVLDGLVAAASALHAHRAVAYVPSAHARSVERALAERWSLGLDPVAVDVVESPDTFLAGQESAVVNGLSGRRAALPSFVGIASVRERGVGGRPTLVHNVETLAHVALVARFGATWFRRLGTDRNPGTLLLTVDHGEGPLIVEGVLGSSLAASVGLTPQDLESIRGVLLGGYGGGWVTPQVFGQLTLTEKAARAAGTTLGAGVVALLPAHVCPLAELADVTRYMEGQGAGQCGPCVHGLADLADAVERLAYGGPHGLGTDRVLEVCNLVDGRGACRHPDGVARFVRTGLSVFAEEVAAHQRRGACRGTHAARVLPVGNTTAGRRLVSRA
jgi:NADH:ubiquinone oxidoreductase subunit F (NADH-binding)